MLHAMLLAQAAGEGGEAPVAAEPGGSLNGAKESAGRLLNGDTGELMRVLETYGLPLLGAIVILIVAFIGGKMLSGMVRKASEKARIDLTLSRFFGKLIYYAVLVVGVMFALSMFGVEVTSFAAILAAAGFAIGMALSGTLGNFAAGAMLLIFRPFKVGDVINAAGVTAKVDAIELFTTTLDTPDNRRIIVPNGSIYSGTIENITYHAQRRVDVNVGVSYSASIDATREVLTRAVESLSDKMITGADRGYQIMLLDLGASSVNWVVRFWTTREDFWAVKEALTRAVKMNLDEAGISIPFPQMDVHLRKLND